MDISTAGKKLELDGRTLLITYWNVDKQLEIMAWITKNFGDQILSLFMDGGDITDHVPNASEDLSEGERVNLAKLITDAFRQLPPKEYAKYAKYIVCDVLEGSKKINMESARAKRLKPQTEILLYMYIYTYIHIHICIYIYVCMNVVALFVV